MLFKKMFNFSFEIKSFFLSKILLNSFFFIYIIKVGFVIFNKANILSDLHEVGCT